MLLHAIALGVLSIAAPQKDALQDPLQVVEGVRIEVLDAETGGAIQNAKVSRVPEATAPIWGEFWSNASEVTDARGLAVMNRPGPRESVTWLIVQAKGYAPFGQMGFPGPGLAPTKIRLEPAVPAKVRVLDFRGEPVPLVYLGQCVGCGHTPDVLGSITDHEGRATLHLVGKSGGDIADVFPVGHGVRTAELGVPWEDAMAGEVDLLVVPGSTISGRVIGMDRLPIAGVAVGSNASHRGPWAVTDQAGRFQLFGVLAGGAEELEIRSLTGQQLGFFGESHVGTERILRLGSDLGSDERAGEKAKLKLRLDVIGYGKEGQEFWQGVIPVRLWDPMTGWMLTAEAKPGTALEIDLLPGTYAAEIGGQGSPFPLELAGPVQIHPGSTTDVVRVLPAIEPRQLRIVDVGAAKGIKLFHSCGAWEDIDFDRVEEREGTRTGFIRHYVLPSPAPGIWVEPGDQDSRAVPFALEPHDGYSLDPIVARRR